MCRELQQYGSRSVSLITADTAMRLRAQALNVSAVQMPSQYARLRAN